LIARVQSLEYKWLVAAVFVVGLFMDLLDTTVVNVALPTLGEEFDASNTTLQWVVTGYLLSLAVWIPASGWLGDRFGTKRIFLIALAIFTVGSALCGASWSIESLIFFRVIQGVGGGMLVPVGTAMIFRAFPANERAQASAVLTIPVAVAPTIGPILGGLLVDHASWRWIFFINVPLGIIGFIFAFRVLIEHTEPTAGPFDFLGFVLSGAGLPLILYALAEAPNYGWISTRVLATGLLGIALIVLLVIVETKVVPEPMLALRIFNDRMFRTANAVYFMTAAGLIGVLFLLPLFLQQLRGLSATQSGLTTFPQALGIVAIARFASSMYPKIGPRRMLAVGMLITALSTACFLAVDLDTSLWWIRGIMFVRGIAFGLALIPLQAATFATIPPADSGRASALFNSNRQVASSFGVAILATVLVDRTKTYVTDAMANPGSNPQAALQQAGLDGFHDAFFAAVVIAAIGCAAAFLIHDEDAAPSMVSTEQAAAAAAH
jgi:EmrB/QacA subfamily drug resistance transporter